jgi:hypothetical protein
MYKICDPKDITRHLKLHVHCFSANVVILAFANSWHSFINLFNSCYHLNHRNKPFKYSPTLLTYRYQRSQCCCYIKSFIIVVYKSRPNPTRHVPFIIGSIHNYIVPSLCGTFFCPAVLLKDQNLNSYT